MYTLCPVGTLIIEYMIAMAVTSKYGIRHKLPSVQEKLDIRNMVYAT
jgi:hypothetical protein